MNLTLVPSLSPRQIEAEIAEIRKAGRAILASRTKRIAFLREIGVLTAGNGKKKTGRRR